MKEHLARLLIGAPIVALIGVGVWAGLQALIFLMREYEPWPVRQVCGGLVFAASLIALSYLMGYGILGIAHEDNKEEHGQEPKS